MNIKRIASLAILLYLSPMDAFSKESECNLPLTTAATSWPKRVLCTKDTLESCIKPSKDKANLPLEFYHGKKTEYVMVLFHGLSDSPYYFKDIGALAFNAGMNVIVPRLTGMGSCPEHLGRDFTKLEDWIGGEGEEPSGDLQFALDQAKKVGKKIIIGGFSLGGTIAIYGTLKYEGLPQYPIHGLLLFSPAIKLSNRNNILVRIETAIARFLRRPAPYNGKKNYGEGVRYQKISADAAHDVIFLTKKIEQMERKIRIPVLNVVTTGDNTVDLKAALDFSNTHGSTSLVVLYTDKKSENKFKIIVDKKIIYTEKNLEHSYIMLEDAQWSTPEKNPYFEQFKSIFKNFLNANFRS